jgi:6-pyruvoyltetrahydropterin/6-carboxytetrahydropterin synthase
VEIWKILETKLPSITKFGSLYSIRVFETPRNYVDYYGAHQPVK